MTLRFTFDTVFAAFIIGLIVGLIAGTHLYTLCTGG